MKNVLSFLIVTLFALCTYAQNAKHNNRAPKTIIVYDTVIVYDTLTVYDTIKTEKKPQSENNFKNNYSAEKAYLAIDTNNLSAAVLLINKTDTATLSINSIILSENSKNLDTMKTQLLTLLAVAALNQASISQNLIIDAETGEIITQNTTIAKKSQDSVNVKTKEEDVVPKYTLTVGGAVSAHSSFRYRFYGINFKADKVIGNKGKTLLGVSSDIGLLYSNGFSNTHNIWGPLRGSLGNVFLNFTRYLIGSASKNRNALYVTTGLGAITFKHSKKDIFNVDTGNPINTEWQDSGFNVGQNVGIGSEWNFGKGKLYTEVSGVLIYAEQSKRKVIDASASGTTENIYKYSGTIFDASQGSGRNFGIGNLIMLHIGYKFNLQ